jgi:hypothetical protein
VVLPPTSTWTRLDERECEVEVGAGVLFLVLLGLVVVVVIEDADNEGSFFVLPSVRAALALETRFCTMPEVVAGPGPGPDPRKGAEDAFRISAFTLASAMAFSLASIPLRRNSFTSSVDGLYVEFGILPFVRVAALNEICTPASGSPSSASNPISQSASSALVATEGIDTVAGRVGTGISSHVPISVSTSSQSSSIMIGSAFVLPLSLAFLVIVERLLGIVATIATSSCSCTWPRSSS